MRRIYHYRYLVYRIPTEHGYKHLTNLERQPHEKLAHFSQGGPLFFKGSSIDVGKGELNEVTQVLSDHHIIVI
jgi:hypothetical protein